MIKTLVLVILLLILEYCSNREFNLIDPFENIKSHLKLNQLFPHLSNKTKIEETIMNKAFILTSNEINFTINEPNNETDFCSEKTDELIKYFLNPENSTITFDDIKGFILYSSIGLNDYGDYTNCVNNPEYNYISVYLKFKGISARMGLCYYEACNATYFNNAKIKLINLLNARYAMNITDDNVYFTNPKDNMEKYRNKSETGFILWTVLFSLIALFSVLKLIFTIIGYKQPNNRAPKFIEKPNSYSAINETYEKSKDPNYDAPSIESEEISDTDVKNKSNMVLAFLDNFDLIKHTKAIFSLNNPNKIFEYLRVFDGVRVLSTAWVLWGHVFYIAMGIGPRNFYEALNFSESFLYCILTSAMVSVDVFFYMSGFLLYFNLQKYIKNAKNKIVFFLVSLFQRYVRLLPIYFITVFYIGYLLPFILNSGKSDDLFPALESCKKYWWANLLYIQNFLNYDENKGYSCVGHSWYLGDDMFYFIFFTIIFLLIGKRKTIQYVIIWGLFIVSCVWSIVEVIRNNYSTNFKKLSEVKGNYFFDYYINPLARICPYLMGILYCELFFETDIYLNKTDKKKEGLIESTTDAENPLKDEDDLLNSIKEKNSFLRKINVYLKNNDGLCLIIFIISLIFINYTVFMNKYYQMYKFSPGAEAFVLTFNKIIFIFGLGNIIHLIFLEKLVFIKDFLSAKIFTQLSRLTYGVYLLHYYVIYIFFYNSDSGIRINLLEYTFFALGIMIITLFISYVVGILFESPVISMLKFLKGDSGNSSKTSNKKQSK